MKIKKKNIPIRNAVDHHGLFMYQLTQIMGISESALVKKMRIEWSEEEQKRVINLIEEYAKGEGNV